MRLARSEAGVGDGGAAPAKPRRRTWQAPAVGGLLVVAAGLAITSLLGDSVTCDETSHLFAGMSYIKTGDYRMAPDHPPLAKFWCALPLLFVPHDWPSLDNDAWRTLDVYKLGQAWLFERNDGQRLVVIGRLMMVVLLLATLLVIYALGRILLGPGAALLATAIAALSPELLAHGRYITTDLPVTFCCALILLTFARLMQRATWLRLVAAALALGAASITKMSWPLVLPALAVMAFQTITTQTPRVPTRRPRPFVVIGSLVAMGLVTWATIWTCYQWRYTTAPRGRTSDEQARFETAESLFRSNMQTLLADPATRQPSDDMVPRVIRFAQEHRLLPEAYLLGLSYLRSSTGTRRAYLLGAYSNTGWLVYFPIAFAIKTPLATILLLGAGLLALVWRRTPIRDRVLHAGLCAFVVVYGGYVVLSNLNIGHRHLLPLYPVIYVYCGAAVAWWGTRLGRWLLGAAVAWLVAANAYIHPHYLAYFNELIGGPANGRHYLADSNLDWGQDLLRLADYARAHPQESIKLAYTGSALPTKYLNCKSLPSFLDFGPRADLTGGTYVVAVTQLLGVYDQEIRDDYWDEQKTRDYARLARSFRSQGWDEVEQRPGAAQEYERLRYKRLLNRLQHRDPDGMIGYSLMLYRLSDDEVAKLIAP